jgi:D-alanyl-D-alanine carboxypeptidase/D-alanyl-D-alanine-endopeptidase (penicillin-binding protein 4)
VIRHPTFSFFSFFSFFIPFMISMPSWSNYKETWAEEKSKVRTKTSHSFCVQDPALHKIVGEKSERLVRLASVSKVFTSYWALTALGPYHQFSTTFSYDSQSKNLLIFGSRDPFFSVSSILWAIAQLNQQGITEVNDIQFNADFKLFLEFESPKERHSTIGIEGGITPARTKDGLLKAFQTDKWSSYIQHSYNKLLQQTAGLIQLPQSLSMKARSVTFRPVLKTIPSVNVTVLSQPLYKYLKEINIFSLNYPSDELFNLLGGPVPAKHFFAKELNFDKTDLQMFSGSGLPLGKGRRRLENIGTCMAFLKVVQLLENKLQKVDKTLPEVMLVGGVDTEGTLRGVYSLESLSGAVIAKTGTTNTAITLGGKLSTQQGPAYFGLFFEVLSPAFRAKARQVRDDMVEAIMEDLQGKVPVNYTKQSFLPFTIASANSNGNANPLPPETPGALE